MSEPTRADRAEREVAAALHGLWVVLVNNGLLVGREDKAEIRLSRTDFVKLLRIIKKKPSDCAGWLGGAADLRALENRRIEQWEVDPPPFVDWCSFRFHREDAP